jgi:hypothetical protein
MRGAQDLRKQLNFAATTVLATAAQTTIEHSPSNLLTRR